MPGITKIDLPQRNFGVISEYNERLNKKLTKNMLVEDKPQFFVTSARPGNFGDHVDFKVQLDNWFDENRYLIVLELIVNFLFI